MYKSKSCLITLLFAGFVLTAFQSTEDLLVGDWTGTSKCQVKNSACHDENVVYHISEGNGADLYKIDADRIVDGKAVDMGELDFKFDKGSHTLTCVYPQGRWVLVVNKTHIDGTLTTPDNVLFRKLSLSKTK